MIRTYRGKLTEEVSKGRTPKGFPPDVARAAQRRFTALYSMKRLEDLLTPPGNRLEALHGDRNGQHSIRINDQWRICFRWVNGQCEDVEIVDYHR